MAVRSVAIGLTNQTAWPLQYVNGGLISSGLYGGGEWSSGLEAPRNIAAGATVNFGTESDGVLVGTEAWALYQILDNSPLQPDPNDPTGPDVPCTSWIYIYWDNPYEGSTSANFNIQTVLVNSSGNPVNSSTGPSVFTSKPLISQYECGTPPPYPASDGSDPSLNWRCCPVCCAMEHIWGRRKLSACRLWDSFETKGNRSGDMGEAEQH